MFAHSLVIQILKLNYESICFTLSVIVIIFKFVYIVARITFYLYFFVTLLSDIYVIHHIETPYAMIYV